jgi:hypothetical protein
MRKRKILLEITYGKYNVVRRRRVEFSLCHPERVRVPACRDKDESKDPEDAGTGRDATGNSLENALKRHLATTHLRDPSTSHLRVLRGKVPRGASLRMTAIESK